MSETLKAITGLILVTLLSLLAFYLERNAIAADLTQRTVAALRSKGHPWVNVNLVPEGKARYRHAYLTGIPPVAGAADEALAIANAVPGIHKAFFDGDKTALAVPYLWRAASESDQVVLSGNVPDKRSKEAIYRYAVELFQPKQVVDQMEISNGAPPGDWVGTAKVGLDELRKLLPGGYAMMSNQSLTVNGSTPSSDVKGAVEGSLATLPNGYSGTARIELDVPDAPQVAEAVAADPCEDKVKASIAGRSIAFETNVATLTPAGQGVLNDVATVLAACPGTSVAVGGHTDSRGNDALNQALSQARAEAVVAYLGGKGVASNRMTAKGFGETAPIDKAENPAAWARNRRIEFAVTKAQ